MRVAVCAFLTFLMLGFLSARAEDCKKLKGFWLDLTPTSDGYLIPIGINGTQHFFLLSLGNAYGIIDLKLVDTLGLPTKAPGFAVLYDGKTVKQIATVSTVQLGILPRHDGEFLVTEHNPSWGPKADGIIGVNIIGGFDIELDLAHNRLGLFLPDHCPFTPYWPFETVGNAPFTVVATGAFLMPMKLDGRDVIVNFGTAHSRTYISNIPAHMLFGIDQASEGVVASGKDNHGNDLFRYPFKALTAGDVTISNPQIFIRQDNVKPCGGIAGDWYNSVDSKFCIGGGDITLGMPELKQLRFFFDFKEKKVYFTTAEPKGK